MDTYDLSIFNYDTYKAEKLEYAEIVSQQTITVNISNKYTLYKILIKKHQYEKLPEEEYIERRYSDFELLNQQLKEEKRGLILPALPAKNMVSLIIMGSKEKQNSRARALELYLNKLMTNEHVWESTVLRRFLSAVSLQES